MGRLVDPLEFIQVLAHAVLEHLGCEPVEVGDDSRLVTASPTPRWCAARSPSRGRELLAFSKPRGSHRRGRAASIETIRDAATALVESKPSTSDFDGQHLEEYMWNGQSSLGFAS